MKLTTEMADADGGAWMDALADEHAFSGVVSVGRAGRGTVRAYGEADRANGLPNAPGTRFGIASGTKFITALAVGALIDEGRLALDARVREVIRADLPEVSPDVTIAHLLGHTSGVFDYYDEELVEDFDNFHVAIPWSFLTTPRDYLPLFEGGRMKFAPGERFSYSNGGYILLGIAIEDVTGALFRDFAAQNVLAPACMEDSGFFALNRLPGRVAVGYMPEPDDGWRTNVYNLPVVGASDGGMFATAADIERLWRAFFADAIVSRATREAFVKPRSKISERVSYGYGVYVWTELDEPAYFIAGSDAGVGFDSRHVPGKDLTVTILSNETDGEEAMRRAILGELIDAS